jgi:glycyl-tRNA synthetase
MMRLPLGNSRGQRENALFLPILFAVLALLLITPLRVPLRAFSLSIAAPVWSLGKMIKHGTQVLLPSVFSRASLAEENMRLRHEIESLRAEEWRTESLRRERDLLASVLHRASSTDALLLAYVLASPNFSPYDTLVVDTGADTGIFTGAKVIVDGGFADAMTDCKNCQHRMRADHLIEDWLESAGSTEVTGDSIKEPLTQELVKKVFETKKVEGLSEVQMNGLVELFNIPCPKCGEHTWTEVRKFNQLFPVNLGIVAGDDSLAYLRGETAQGMFTDFKNIVDSTRVRLPFGVAQNGKSFRNEITPGNSIFRTLVFEQNEIEYFFDEKKSNWEELFEEWKTYIQAFITDVLKVREENIRWREHTDEERSFYSKRTEDVEYKFPFGFKELWGLAYRTNYDLTQHQKYSGQELTINDPYTQEKILPHVIEPAVGTDRLMLMVLCDAYAEIEDRIVLKIAPSLAPTKVAVFPLVANKEEITGKAKEVYETLRKQFVTVLDDRGNIGKRYLYQDEVGTPWCVTIDYQTLEDGTVTVRDRDTAQQERITIDTLTSYIHTKLNER